MHAYIDTCMHTYMHTHIDAYMHTHIHTYVRTYIHDTCSIHIYIIIYIYIIYTRSCRNLEKGWTWPYRILYKHCSRARWELKLPLTVSHIPCMHIWPLFTRAPWMVVPKIPGDPMLTDASRYVQIAIPAEPTSCGHFSVYYLSAEQRSENAGLFASGLGVRHEERLLLMAAPCLRASMPPGCSWFQH